MLCSAPVHDPAFASRQGCNVSVTLSDDAFGDLSQLAKDVSPKKASFFDNLMRRNSSSSSCSSPKKEVKEKSSTPKSPRWAIFSKKTIPAEEQQDKATAELIEQLELEGRSEDEINMHLSYIHDMNTVTSPTPVTQAAPPAPPAPPAPLSPQPKSTNIISQFFRDVQTAFKEEFGVGEVTYYYPNEYEEDIKRLTIGISSAPFYGALPADADLSYEELSRLEAVSMASEKCINYLPCCVHDGSPLPGEQTKCPVCLGDFEEGNSLKSLPCVHFFHTDCIDSWLMVGHTCPVCKLLLH